MYYQNISQKRKLIQALKVRHLKNNSPQERGAGMAIDEESANTVDNNQMMELDNNDIQCNTEYNDDNSIEGSIWNNAEDEYIDIHAEQEAAIEEATIEHEEEFLEDRITIDDINIVTKMKTLQMAVSQQMAIHQEVDETLSQLPTHNYNLRRRTTKKRERTLLVFAYESTGVRMKGNTWQSTQRCMPT